jgi:DNA-directed RNA polymerase specialized sigma24 family protein
VSAAVLTAKVLDMSVFHTISEMTGECSFAEELENAVVQKNTPSSLPTPEDIVILKEELANVYEAMAKLPHKDINVFMMRYYDNCRISEISRKYVMSPSRIETSLRNTTTNVRKDLMRRGYLY